MKMLDNKVCLVTGGTRGIGRAIVERFAQEGAIVYINGRDEEILNKIAKGLEEKYITKVYPVCFDVCDEKAAKRCIMQIKKEQGKLDVLVNNAGIMKDANIGMVSKEMVRDIFEVNVFAMIDMLQLAARVMQKQENGSIINISSIVGRYGNKGQIAYSASKGAVIALTKTAAKELAIKNIRVNTVAPGMIDTEMFRSIGEEHIKERVDMIGMQRVGEPIEVADTCVYLASDLSRYVTGQVVGVDGCAVV